MTRQLNHCGLIVVAGLIAGALPAIAQQTPGGGKALQTGSDAPAAAQSSASPQAAPAASSSTAAAPPARTDAPAAPTGPSPDVVKKARSLGMHEETSKSGATVFCREDADTGTRFKTKKCATEAQLQQMIDQKQVIQDTMRRGLTGTASK